MNGAIIDPCVPIKIEPRRIKIKNIGNNQYFFLYNMNLINSFKVFIVYTLI